MSNLLALIFGAVIVVFFAYERFNSAGYQGSQQFERLVAYLSPDKLRARRVVLRAYIFYAATLVAIYFFLCTYAQVLPLLGASGIPADAIGATSIGAQAADADTGRPKLNISPSISLTVALIMVGLAPSFPILDRFEHWMRSTAHRLAGIPTRVIEAADNLRHRSLDFNLPSGSEPVPKNTLLIRRGDWQRMVRYQSESKGGLAAPEDFRDDLKTVFAVSSWILDRKLKLSSTRDRLRFQPLEAALRKRVDALVHALDEKSGFARPETQPHETAPAGLVTEAAASEAVAPVPVRVGWERLAREADELADDLCVLLALYVEHEIIPASSQALAKVAATAQDASTASENASRHQHDEAKKKLEEFLDLHGGPSHSVQPQVAVTVFWTLGVVLTVSLVWSVFPGALEAEMQGQITGRPYYRALDYSFNGLSTFVIPMLITLALRDSGLQSHHWNSLWSDHWTLTLPQSAVVVLASSALATLILVAANIWIVSLSPEFKLERPWTYVGFQIQYVGPAALRGAALAWIVMLMLDAQLDTLRKAPKIQENARKGRKPDAQEAARLDMARPWSWLRSVLWAVLAAVMMALVGAVTRSFSALAGAYRYGEELNDIDRGLIVYAAIYSALITFLVVYCVSEAVRNVRGSFRSGARGGAPSQPPRQVTAE